jgi:HK97 gp10 family phage protein
MQSTTITFSLEDPALKTKLAVLPEKMADHAEEVLLNQAHLIAALAQVYAPVDTGSLRDSIRVERGGKELRWRQITVRAGGYVTNPRTGKKVDYAGYQEFGTRYFYGKFYLTRAVEEVKPIIELMLKSGLVEKALE